MVNLRHIAILGTLGAPLACGDEEVTITAEDATEETTEIGDRCTQRVRYTDVHGKTYEVRIARAPEGSSFDYQFIKIFQDGEVEEELALVQHNSDEDSDLPECNGYTIKRRPSPKDKIKGSAEEGIHSRKYERLTQKSIYALETPDEINGINCPEKFDNQRKLRDRFDEIRDRVLDERIPECPAE